MTLLEILFMVLIALVFLGRAMVTLGRKLLWRGIRPAAPGEPLVLIAAFMTSDLAKDRNIAPELKRAIEKTLAEADAEPDLKNVRVALHPTRLLSDDLQNATRLGRRFRASIMVWGTDTGDRVTWNVLGLNDPETVDSSNPEWDRYRVDENTFILPPPSTDRFSTPCFPQRLERLDDLSRLILGFLYGARKAYPAAVRMLATDKDPPWEGLARLDHRLGWLHHVPLENPTLARAYYDKAIKRDPAFVEAYNNRGVLKLFSNDPVGALADFDQALKLNPGLIGALMSRGTLYSRLGKLELAVEDYDRFLSLAGNSPFNIAAYFGRGTARSKLGILEEAIDDFQKALAMEPDDNIRGAILYSIAVTLKKRALQAKAEADRDPDAIDADLSAALAYFRQAIEGFSSEDDRANACFEMAEILHMQGQWDDCLESLNAAIPMFQDAQRADEALHFRETVRLITQESRK